MPETKAEAPASDRPVSAKALSLLGATAEEVRFERAYVLSRQSEQAFAGQRMYIECVFDEESPAAPDPAPEAPKVSRILGVENEPPLNKAPMVNELDWLQRRQSLSGRSLRSKALATLGATYEDVRIEKALLVLGEAPGREVPAGKLPRPGGDWRPKVWAVPPPSAEPPAGLSVFLLAFLPWGVLAPLNLLKLQLNKVSPGAHLWVPLETEQCQAACGVARMWATLFWSMQFANALAAVYLHYHRERGLALLGASHKIVVGATLLKAYVSGVIYWPIGLLGAVIEWVLAVLFLRELHHG